VPTVIVSLRVHNRLRKIFEIDHGWAGCPVPGPATTEKFEKTPSGPHFRIRSVSWFCLYFLDPRFLANALLSAEEVHRSRPCDR